MFSKSIAHNTFCSRKPFQHWSKYCNYFGTQQLTYMPTRRTGLILDLFILHFYCPPTHGERSTPVRGGIRTRPWMEKLVVMKLTSIISAPCLGSANMIFILGSQPNPIFDFRPLKRLHSCHRLSSLVLIF